MYSTAFQCIYKSWVAGFKLLIQNGYYWEIGYNCTHSKPVKVACIIIIIVYCCRSLFTVPTTTAACVCTVFAVDFRCCTCYIHFIRNNEILPTRNKTGMIENKRMGIGISYCINTIIIRRYYYAKILTTSIICGVGGIKGYCANICARTEKNILIVVRSHRNNNALYYYCTGCTSCNH